MVSTNKSLEVNLEVRARTDVNLAGEALARAGAGTHGPELDEGEVLEVVRETEMDLLGDGVKEATTWRSTTDSEK